MRTMKDQMDWGCGNHSCVVKTPEGQGTTGPCTCSAEVRRLEFEKE